MIRFATGLYLLSLALLPWSRPAALPWLHPRAQWSDLLLAAALALWLAGRLRDRRAPRLRPVHLAYGAYLGAAAISWLANGAGSAGAAKLLGMAALAGLALLTSELVSRPAGARAAGAAMAAGALTAAAGGLVGAVLFWAGWSTWLVGSYGDLVPGAYPRVQAGFTHPNLLASYAIAAAGIVASPAAGLPRGLRRVVLGSLLAVVALTFSRAALGLVVALLVAAASSAPRRRLAAAWVGVSLLAIASLSAFNLSLDPTRPWQARWEREPSSRRQMATSAWRTLIHHPLVGTGPGELAAVKDGVPHEAHLTPLNVAALMGLPALAGFVAIPVLLWRARGRPVDRAAWGAAAGLALDALAQDVEDFRHVWVLFGWLDGTGVSGAVPGVDRSPSPGLRGARGR